MSSIIENPLDDNMPPATDPPRKVHRSQWIVIGCAGTIALLLAIGVAVVVILQTGTPLATTTRTELEAAKARWEENGPADYDITVKVGGRRPATYRVEVRDEIARQAWLDDRPLKQRRLFSVWSVPGMFATIDREFDLKEAGNNPAGGTPKDVQIHCRWHKTLGFPQSYQRLAGAGDDIYWEVTHFVSYPDGTSE